MTRHKLDYHSPSPRQVRPRRTGVRAAVGVAVFSVPVIVSLTLFVCWDAPWDADWGLRALFLLFATAMGLGVWHFASRIWKMCRQD
jgi:hypothetical protein